MSKPTIYPENVFAQSTALARATLPDVGHDDTLDMAEQEAFVHAMSCAVTGVNVVTTDGPGGRFGLTVSAMSSLCADPPMLLVCINRKSPLCAALHANRRFGVNVLADTQRHISSAFSGHPERGVAYAFTPDEWELNRHETPRLRGAVAQFDCDLDTSHDFGTHTLFVGRVRAAEGHEGTPLLYNRRTYGRPHPQTA